MKLAGIALVTVGFLAGALVAVLDPDRIDPGAFIAAALVAASGVALLRVAAHRASRDTARIEANFRILDESLARAVGAVRELDETKDAVDVHDLPARIDRDVAEHLAAFAGARESIVHVWGSQAYADVMSPFAAGERYLNRVWAAAADGWIDEAHAYLGRSHEQLADALAQLERLRAEPRSP